MEWRQLCASLDKAEEKREMAAIKLAYYQHKLRQGYNKKVKSQLLVLGDLVLKKVVANTKNPSWDKLGRPLSCHLNSRHMCI